MKYLTIIAMFLLINVPHSAFSQTKLDYENAIMKVRKYYNNNQSDSLCRMFQNYHVNGICLWDSEDIKSTQDNFGKIESFRYMFIDTLTRHKGVTLIKVVASKRTFIIGCILNEDKRFKKFEWNIGSTYIDSLIYKNY